ncbi:pancreatic lipase-related protein 2-like [Sitodiplosis mosellana]|uniref:pancreatic lipase-related protein 2-like n=1 Tax=Sitodiplosis mosellana TaxID=263140 RepID=UPI002444A377|nr:pancreatic lipase-related protein 2-like [Sitodiplosis mosellana]
MLGRRSFTLLLIGFVVSEEIDHMFSLWSKGSGSSAGGNNNIPSLSRQQTGLGKDDVIFELYTLKNKDTPQILSIDNITSITKSNFNKNVPTRFVIHGYLEYNGKLKRIINDAYLSKAKFDANLIAVNWEKFSQTFNYIAARSKVNSIGIHVAAMIDYMVKNHLASINDISLIGFSLGAHIAGIAGKNVKSGKLPKIIGLDPAAPLFSLDKPTERLNRGDAKFVEVIHTNGAFLGIENPIGTVDFYPNTGLKQPGCSNDLLGRCSHWRAVEYFVESIYSPIQFYAYPCSSFDDMKKRNCKGHGLKMGGKPGNKNAEASIYYLTTNSESIFARGESNQHSFTGIHG